jgi:hypothetical protein
MMINLKANKVNLFVASVLFVFWYHSPNVLDTPHICNISRLRVNQPQYILYITTEAIWPEPVPGGNSRMFAVSSASDWHSTATWIPYVLHVLFSFKIYVLIMNVIYRYIPSNTSITVFQLVFISSYMFRPVYNGHLQAVALGGVLHIV